MKKLVSLAVAAVLVLSIGAVAFAAETTFSGAYRVRAWTEWNFDKEVSDIGNVPSHEDGIYTGFFDQRFRLTITHTRSEYLKAVIRLDIVEDVWGQGRAFRINAGNQNYIDRAYIEFKVDPVGTFRVGRFSENFGTRAVYDTVADGARWSNAWGPVAVSLSYFKVSDRVTRGAENDWYNWDADLVASSIVISPIDGHELEVFGGVLWDRDATGDSGLGGVLGNSYAWTGNTGYYDAVIGFVGVGYTGNIVDMIDINVEASWVIGSANAHWNPAGAIANPYNTGIPANNARSSLDISGWNVYADVSYYNDLLRVGVAFMMGSGQEHNWGNNAQWEHINMNFVTDDGGYSFGHIITGGHNDGRASLWRGGPPLFASNSMENITAIKAYFEVCPVDKLTISGAVIWAKWTEEIGANGLTRANLFAADMPAYAHPATYLNAPNYTYHSWEISDDLGWEIDLAVSYEIMEGLTYTLEGGVLFTGDSWDYEKADGTRGDWGQVWSIVNTLQYRF